MPRVDQHQIRLLRGDLFGEVEQYIRINGGNVTVNDLDFAPGIGVFEHQLQEIRKRGLGRIGKTQQGRSAKHKNTQNALVLILCETILAGGQARVLVREKTPGCLRVEAVILSVGHKEIITWRATHSPLAQLDNNQK